MDLLALNIPIVDPSLFIARFASKLDFGDRQGQVIRVALRLVQRLDRDWIQTGRRPAGICAASKFVLKLFYNSFPRLPTHLFSLSLPLPNLYHLKFYLML